MAKTLGMYKNATDYEKGADKVPAEVQVKYAATKTKVAGHFKNNPSKEADKTMGDEKNYVTVVQDGDKYSVEMFIKGKKDATTKLN